METMLEDTIILEGNCPLCKSKLEDRSSKYVLLFQCPKCFYNRGIIRDDLEKLNKMEEYYEG